MLASIMNEAKKIVIKIGSNTLANEDGTINKEFLQKSFKKGIFSK